MSTRLKNRPLFSANAGGTAGGQGQGVSTGSLALDLKLGTGGWPRGRIVELFGAEGSGKTTLALQAIAHAQRNNGFGAFIDADHGTALAAAGRLGVDVDAMPLHQTNGLEDAFEKIEELVRGGAVDVIALDSIAALLPEGAQDCSRSNIPLAKNPEHQHRVNHFLKALLGPLSRSRAVLLITNQVVEKLGVMYGNPETTPWETMPLRSYASQRVELRRVTTIKDGEEALGYEVKASVVKNRLAAPLVKAEFELHFATGICAEAELLALGLEAGLLEKRGGRISHGDLLLGTNRADVLRHLRQDAELAARLRAGIIERLQG
jgi:recombination protein RecA